MVTANTPSAAGKVPIAVRLVELLLAAGADVNAQDDCGATPLDLLVKKLNAMDILRDGKRADFDRAAVLNDLLQRLQSSTDKLGEGNQVRACLTHPSTPPVAEPPAIARSDSAEAAPA